MLKDANNEVLIMDFKDKLIYVRAKLNLSQVELAEKLNVSFPTISRWENGKTRPTKKSLVAFNVFCKENNIVWEE